MNEDFNLLIENIINGDPASAEKLIRDCAPEVRRIVRFRLRDPRLRRIVDSTDICQSVFGKFFFLATLGRFEFKQPEDVIKLLAKMASNRIIDRYRSESTQRKLNEERAKSREFTNAGEELDRSEFPEHVAERREMLATIKERLTENEREISRLRSHGHSWLEVSKALGESPQALRKRLERACDRIFSELGIRTA